MRLVERRSLGECLDDIEEGPPNLFEKIDEAREIGWIDWNQPNLPEWAEEAIERGKKKLLEKELKRIEKGDQSVVAVYHAEELLGPTGSDRLERAIQKGERVLLDKYIARIRKGEVRLFEHGDGSLSAKSLAKKCGMGEDILEDALKEGYPKKFDKYLQSIAKGDTYRAEDARELAKKGGLDVSKVEKALEKWVGVVKRRELHELKDDLKLLRAGRTPIAPLYLKGLAEKYGLDPTVVERAEAEGAERRLAKRSGGYGK